MSARPPVIPVVLVDSPVPHIARLRINRPEKRNAIDSDDLQDPSGCYCIVGALPGVLEENFLQIFHCAAIAAQHLRILNGYVRGAIAVW